MKIKNKNQNIIQNLPPRSLVPKWLSFLLLPTFLFSLSTPHTNAAVKTSASVPGPTNGLVGYWTLDGKDTNWGANQTYDRSGQGNTAILTNMSTTSSPIQGAIGQALYFNGAGTNLVQMPYNTTLDFGTGDFTVSLWEKTTRTSNYQTFFNRDNVDVGNGIILCSNITNGVLRTWVGGTAKNGTINIVDGKWHHAILVRRAGVIYQYIDGNFDVQIAAAGNVNMSNNNLITIGDYIPTSYPMLGSIDDIRIYSRALSVSEIKSLYNLGATGIKSNASQTSTSVPINSGLVGYWPLDGKDTNWGTNILADRSGFGNNGSLSLMSTTTSPVTGKIGQALSFNGGNYIEIPDNVTLMPTNQITVSAWIKPTASGSYRTVVSKGYNTADGGYALRITRDSEPIKTFFQVYNSSAVIGAAGNYNNLPNNVWSHVVGTYDGTQVCLYVNGVMDSPCGALTGTIKTNNLPVRIGRLSTGAGNTEYYPGLVDDVRIYNRALSVSEIKSLYNQGTGGIKSGTSQTGVNVPINSGLVGYWTFDGKDTNWNSNTTADRSVQGNTGTLINMSTTSSPVQGKIGQALNFDGSTSYVRGNDSGLPTGNSARTISAWVYPTLVDSTYRAILSYGSLSTGQGIYLFQQNTGMAVSHNGGTCDAYSSVVLSANQWQYVTVTKPAGSNTYSFYVNGVFQGTAAPVSCTINTALNSDLEFGRRIDSGVVNFKGNLDDVRIYNRALSATEVKNLYNQGR